MAELTRCDCGWRFRTRCRNPLHKLGDFKRPAPFAPAFEGPRSITAVVGLLALPESRVEAGSLALQLRELVWARRGYGLERNRQILDDAEFDAITVATALSQTDPFTIESLWEEVEPIWLWANEMLVSAALVCGMVDGSLTVRMKNGEPAFTIAEPATPPAASWSRKHGSRSTLERDSEIRRRLTSGQTGNAVAKEFGLTGARVSQIRHSA